MLHGVCEVGGNVRVKESCIRYNAIGCVMHC
jgi:hypothetical protein